MTTEMTKRGEKMIRVLQYMNTINCQNTEGDYVRLCKHLYKEFHEDCDYEEIATIINNVWNAYFSDEETIVMKTTNNNVLAEVQSAFNRGPFSKDEVSRFAHSCHRTIQQNVMRFIRDYIVCIATDWTLSFDDRNSASVSFAKDLWKIEDAKAVIQRATFPFI